jgi:hypothetical protein
MWGAGAVIMRLKTYAEDSPAHLNYQHIAANAAALLGICEHVFCILTQQRNITSPDIIAEWDWQQCRALSVVPRHMTGPENSRVYLDVVEVGYLPFL